MFEFIFGLIGTIISIIFGIIGAVFSIIGGIISAVFGLVMGILGFIGILFLLLPIIVVVLLFRLIF